MNSAPSWLSVTRGDAPLLVSLPHTGTDLAGLEPRLVSPWRGRCDTDWHIEKLYAFATDLGATVIRTAISRTVIDVNRDPSGASLYPGQTTTGLCPTETFQGEPLYRPGGEPLPSEIDRRREAYFAPYHVALAGELHRLKSLHRRVVLYDCHSIRSVLPRLFQGTLPAFNLGTNDGRSADPILQVALTQLLAESGESFVVNGRFKGGWITRRYGRPEDGVHAVQMELSCRGFLREPPGPPSPENWPVEYDPAFAAPMRERLARMFRACLDWAGQGDLA